MNKRVLLKAAMTIPLSLSSFSPTAAGPPMLDETKIEVATWSPTPW
jgi:hypothetical protein